MKLYYLFNYYLCVYAHQAVGPIICVMETYFSLMNLSHENNFV